MRRRTEEFDSPWKDALERWFEPFIQLCFPWLHSEIDWSRPPEFLDTELRQVVRRALVGRRHVDRLVRIWNLNGEDAWVLIHVEVQVQEDRGFARRMARYHLRIFDRYDRSVCSLGVLADANPGWRPDRFVSELWRCRLGLEFPVVKLLDFTTCWEELERSANPFAPVIMAHLKALETRRAPRTRYEWKMRIARGLYEHRWSTEQIRELYRVIDWLLALPEPLELQFLDELVAWERKQTMPYVSNMERRGQLKGAIEATQEGILAYLGARLGEVPEDLRESIGSLSDLERLRQLRQFLFAGATVEQLRQELMN